MNSPLRRLSVKLFFIFISVILFTAVSWQLSEGTLNLEQIHNSENTILAELVALKLQIVSTRSQMDSLDELLQKNLREKAAKEQELAQIRKDLSVSKKELGKWLEFSYRHGYIGILDMLVSSADFNDFINRSTLLWAIVEQQTRAYEKNRSLRNQAEEKLDSIKAINITIQQDRVQLEKTIARIKKSEDELVQYMDELKKQSAELESRLGLLSQQWTEVTSLTSGIIHQLSNLPVEDFIPDEIKFTFSGMRLEYSDKNINQAIVKVNSNPSASINVNIKPELITISGSTGNPGVNFNARGNFIISPDKKKIIFAPQVITVGNHTLEGHMLNTILNNSNLTWDITRYYPNLSITGLSSGDGTIAFSLKY